MRRMFALLAMLAMIAVPMAGTAAPSAWERIDPIAPPGEFGFHDIEPDPRIPGRLYLGTDTAGVYRSDNYGTSWVRISPAGYFTGNNWALAVDRFNGSLYALDGYGSKQGIHKSTDGGVSWTQLLSGGQTPIDAYNVATDPYLADHVIATFHGSSGWSGGDNTPVIESFNGGATWTVHPLTVGSGHYAMFLDNGSTWLLGTQGSGILAHGQQWANMDQGQQRQYDARGFTGCPVPGGVVRGGGGRHSAIL
jgi:hypothetical protein